MHIHTPPKKDLVLSLADLPTFNSLRVQNCCLVFPQGLAKSGIKLNFLKDSTIMVKGLGSYPEARLEASELDPS